MAPMDDTVEIELGVSRRSLLKQLSAAGMLSGMAGCSSLLEGTPTPTRSATRSPTAATTGDETATNVEQTAQDQQDADAADLPAFKRTPMVPPPTADEMDLSNPRNIERRLEYVSPSSNEFYTPTIAGLNDALNLHGWTGRFRATNQFDQEEHINLINTTLQTMREGRDVLGITALDANAYINPVQNALDKDIPVVGWDSRPGEWDYEFMVDTFGFYVPYHGDPPFQSGVAAGVTAYEKAQSTLDDEQLVVQPTNPVPGFYLIEERLRGFERALGFRDNVTLLDPIESTLDQSKAISRVNDAYNANPDINVILASGFTGAIGGGRLVENQGLQGEMVVGGFDLVSGMLNGIKNGTIQFTLGTSPYSYGFMGGQQAWAYMDRGIPMKDFFTGVTVVDETAIDFALKRGQGWGGLIDYLKGEQSG